MIAADLKRFREESGVDDVVVVNLASTERWPDLDDPTLNSPDAFERGLDSSDEAISRRCSTPTRRSRTAFRYANFTPSVAADVPALVDIARQLNVPVAGKDGKTGQTMMKTVLAPAFKSRRSTSTAGSRPTSSATATASLSTTRTRSSRRSTPRARCWTRSSATRSRITSSISTTTARAATTRSLGQHRHHRLPRPEDADQGQLPLQGLDPGRPLVIEIARVLDLAKKRGDGGVQEQLSLFFKAPMVTNGHGPSTPSARRSGCCSTGSASTSMAPASPAAGSPAAAPANLRALLVELIRP